MPHADTAATNAHLAETSRTVAEGAHAIVRRENTRPDCLPVPLTARRRRVQGAKALARPDNITLPPLPRHAPDLNPIENACAHLRANRLAISVVETRDEIVARCCNAWNSFPNDIDTVRSITPRDYARTLKS